MGASAAYDPSLNGTLLFGGVNFTQFQSLTWLYRDGTWTNISSPGPSPRHSSAMVYDQRDGYMLLFGGYNAGAYYGDTWAYFGNAWHPLSPSTAPDARYASNMVYDTLDNTVLLFGGCDAVGCGLNDTWSFQGGDWSQITTRTAPSPRHWASASYDPVAREVVLFGGCVGAWGCTPIAGDTWTFSGGKWTNISGTLSTAPSARAMATMFWDGNDNATIFFGGADTSQLPVHNDTWSFASGVWSQLTRIPNPGYVDRTSVSWDPVEHIGLFFGGQGAGSQSISKTWALYSSLTSTASGSPTPLHVLKTVTFTDQPKYGVPPEAVSWAFGDGSLGTGLTATHAYTTANNYTATATSIDLVGDESNASTAVRVVPPLTVVGLLSLSSFDVGTVIYANATPQDGIGAVNVSWYWGDGSFSNLADGVHAFGLPGTLVATASAVDSTGEAATSGTTVIVSALPTVVASALPGSAQEAQSINFTASISGGTAPFTLSWSFDDGGSATGLSASHAFARSGSHVGTVTVVDSVGATTSNFTVITVAPPATVPPPAVESGFPVLWGWTAVGAAAAGWATAAAALALRRGRRSSPPSAPGPESAQ